jgi:hypothetical protein
MQVPAIFVPIVHKTFLKSAPVKKNTINPFIFNQLLILLKIYIYLANIHKTGNSRDSPFIAGPFKTPLPMRLLQQHF